MPVQTSSPTPRSTHVFDANDLARAQPALYRLLAVLLWLFSFIGNVLLFGGGWSAFLAAWSAGSWPRLIGEALLWSFVYQAFCTVVQFIFCRHWANPIYLLALFASFVPSFIGYRPLIAGPLVTAFTGLPDPWANARISEILSALHGVSGNGILWILLIHLAFALVLLLFDIVPERVFVRH